MVVAWARRIGPRTRDRVSSRALFWEIRGSLWGFRGSEGLAASAVDRDGAKPLGLVRSVWSVRPLWSVRPVAPVVVGEDSLDGPVDSNNLCRRR